MDKRNSRKVTKKNNVPARYRLILLGLLVLLAVGANVCSKERNSPDYRNSERHASTAIYGDLMDVLTPDTLPQTVVQYRGMDVSFNPEYHIPNWVSWELTRDETHGDIGRTNKFITDATVPGCPSTDDYRNSGYDRGHMAPAGDMKWNAMAMNETFYLTNICPQAKQLNTGAWKKLEEKCRVWARRDSSIYIVCGPILSDKITKFIGENRVGVPERFFKVVIAPYSNPARGIGFIMKNGENDGGMQKCVTSINEIERITGLDFFHNLPDSIENIIEAQKNFNDWN